MIEVNNLTTNVIDENFLKGVAKKVLKGENKEGGELSIALVGQGRMRELNKKYRRKNKVTDVLAFGQEEKFIKQFLGEIVICLREVKKNAKKFGLSFEKELARVLIHGILHLLGYKDEGLKQDVDKMRKKEEKYLLGVD